MELKSGDKIQIHNKTPCCKVSDDTNIPFTIYHQNIQGLKSKVNEFMLTLLPETPHLICFSEHHLQKEEISNIHIPEYKLASTYSRSNLKCGGVCIFIQENIKFSDINLSKFNKDQDLEISAVKLKIINKNIIVFCMYRSPIGDLDSFFKIYRYNT
jgi:exonuclease III